MTAQVKSSDKDIAWLLFICGFFLVITCAYIALRIEWFNSHSQTPLPHTGPYTGKWRVSIADRNHERRRQELQFRLTLETKVLKEGKEYDWEQPLTPEQHTVIEARTDIEVKKRRLESDFRDFARSGGLWQTLLVPLLFITAILCLRRRGWPQKVIGGIYLLVACWAIALMMHRGYLLGFV